MSSVKGTFSIKYW